MSFDDSPAISGRDRWFVAAILLASFFYMAFYNSSPIKSIGADQVVYNRLAVNMLNGHGFSQSSAAPFSPAVARTPGYPAFLAVIYAVFGVENFEAVRFTQICLMLLSALMIFKTALLASESKCTAFAALLFFCAHGFDYYSGEGVYGYLFTEPLVIFFASASVLLLMLVVVKKRMTHAVLLGSMMALAMLTRPANMLFPAAAAAFLLWADFSRSTIKLAAAMLFAAALLAVPWTLRNYSRFNKVIPLSVSLKGLYLYGGIANNPDYIYSSYFQNPVQEVEIPAARRAEADSATSALWARFLLGAGGADIYIYDDKLKEIGVEAIKKNKIVFLKRWGYRILSHWSMGDFAAIFYDPKNVLTVKDGLRAAAKALFIFFSVFAFFRNYKRPVFLALLLFPVYNTLIYTPLAMDYRYCLPARGMVFIVAAIGLCELVRRIRRASGHEVAAFKR